MGVAVCGIEGWREWLIWGERIPGLAEAGMGVEFARLMVTVELGE